MISQRFLRKETNLWNKGLISADRSNKATLLLTIPRSVFKSSAKDLSRPIFEIAIRRQARPGFPPAGPKHPDMIQGPKPYLYSPKHGRGKHHRVLARILT
ncbi:hypothetical protein VTP21DRAFT_9681 [Calcarisporiella thermophila]